MKTDCPPIEVLRSVIDHELSNEVVIHVEQCDVCTSTIERLLEATDVVKELRPPLPLRFEMRRLLGAGGMGDVYLAWDHHFRREVAIKILNQSRRGDPVMVARFQREMELLKNLDDPHVQRVFDHATWNGTPYGVLELIEGTSVRDQISECPLTPPQAAEIVVQVCKALTYLHGMNIVHHDVKPSNLMLSDENVVKLIDFGIASSPFTQSELTEAGDFIGTPAYRDSHTHRGHAKSDIYGLGKTWIHLLTGRPPVEDDDAQTWDALRNRNVPQWQIALIQSMLSSVVADRPTASQVLERLSPPRHAPRRTLLVAAGFLALAVVAGVIITIHFRDGTKKKVEVKGDVAELQIEQLPEQAESGAATAQFAQRLIKAGGRVVALNADGSTNDSSREWPPPKADYTIRDASFKALKDPDPTLLSGLSGAGVEHVDFSNCSGIDQVLTSLKGSGVRRVTLTGCKVGQPSLKSLCQVESLETLTLEDTPVNAETIAPLVYRNKLHSLLLIRTGINGGCLDTIHRVPHLLSLDLTGMALDDADTARLAELTRLQSLILDDSGLTDAGLTALSKLHLERFGMAGTKVTDKAVGQWLADVGRRRALTYLDLSRNPSIASEALRAIGQCENLRELNLNATGFSEADAGQLQSLTRLRSLSLQGTAVTDAVLLKLPLENLTFLNVKGSKASRQGIADLLRLYPSLAIVWKE